MSAYDIYWTTCNPIATNQKRNFFCLLLESTLDARV